MKSTNLIENPVLFIFVFQFSLKPEPKSKQFDHQYQVQVCKNLDSVDTDIFGENTLIYGRRMKINSYDYQKRLLKGITTFSSNI